MTTSRLSLFFLCAGIFLSCGCLGREEGRRVTEAGSGDPSPTEEGAELLFRHLRHLAGLESDYDLAKAQQTFNQLANLALGGTNQDSNILFFRRGVWPELEKRLDEVVPQLALEHCRHASEEAARAKECLAYEEQLAGSIEDIFLGSLAWPDQAWVRDRIWQPKEAWVVGFAFAEPLLHQLRDKGGMLCFGHRTFLEMGYPGNYGLKQDKAGLRCTEGHWDKTTALTKDAKGQLRYSDRVVWPAAQ